MEVENDQVDAGSSSDTNSSTMLVNKKVLAVQTIQRGLTSSITWEIYDVVGTVQTRIRNEDLTAADSVFFHKIKLPTESIV